MSSNNISVYIVRHTLVVVRPKIIFTPFLICLEPCVRVTYFFYNLREIFIYVWYAEKYVLIRNCYFAFLRISKEDTRRQKTLWHTEDEDERIAVLADKYTDEWNKNKNARTLSNRRKGWMTKVLEKRMDLGVNYEVLNLHEMDERSYKNTMMNYTLQQDTWRIRREEQYNIVKNVGSQNKLRTLEYDRGKYKEVMWAEPETCVYT